MLNLITRLQSHFKPQMMLPWCIKALHIFGKHQAKVMQEFGRTIKTKVHFGFFLKTGSEPCCSVKTRERSSYIFTECSDVVIIPISSILAQQSKYFCLLYSDLIKMLDSNLSFHWFPLNQRIQPWRSWGFLLFWVGLWGFFRKCLVREQLLNAGIC